MAKIGDYKIDDIYQGGYSSIDPSENLSPVPTPLGAKDIGMSTDARSANIVKVASQNLSAGAKTIEVNQVFPEIFDSVPNEQLKEVNRLAKLLNVDVTFHAPVVEPSGMTQQGFTESNREAVERQMTQAVERAHLINPDGNVPVTFHTSASLPGKIKTKGKELEETYVINSNSGEIAKIPLSPKKYPGEGETTEKSEVQHINEQQWRQGLTDLSYHSRFAIPSLADSIASGELKESKELGEMNAKERQFEQNFSIGTTYLRNAYNQLKSLYESAYKHGTAEDKQLLDDLHSKIEERAKKIKEDPKNKENIKLMSEIINEGTGTLDKLSTPNVYKPLDEFAEAKTVETFSNVALNTYNEFVKKGKKAPIICIENPPAGGGFSTGEELKNIIEKSREKFVEKLEKNGVSKGEAQKQAEQLIGATWDVGHINMLRKFGYSEKDIIKQTEQVAPLVKHVHLSDNFGFDHTELPMGMGNVPTKKIMEKLGEKGFEGKKIVEALNWWQHFSDQGKIPPLGPTLEAFGSPMYSEGAGPYWNQTIGLQQGYFGGSGMMLPQGHYSQWGGGFSMASLPTELGGQMPGAQGSRMSGTPME